MKSLFFEINRTGNPLTRHFRKESEGTNDHNLEQEQ